MHLYAACNAPNWRRNKDFNSKQAQKCIRKGINMFKYSFGEVYCRIYGWKSRWMAPLMHRRKTKFPTLYPTIYLPKWKFWILLSPNIDYVTIEEPGSSVVLCMTWDWKVASSRLANRHGIVPLSKTLNPLLSTGSNQEMSKHDCKIVDWDVKNQLEQNKTEFWPWMFFDRLNIFHSLDPASHLHIQGK